MAQQENAIVQAEILPHNLDAEIQKAVQMRNALDKLFNDLLQQGIDFDRIPGTDKPTLLKPGAELLCQVFRLATGEVKIINSIEDFEKGIFSYTVTVQIIHRDTGILVATGIGSANSQEVKYKYRNVDQDGEKVKVLNPEPADQQNTLIKMAAKRAYIDGVLKATGASRMFTQDVEDMPWLEPEKASKKQINYIKSLIKGEKEEEVFKKIGEILNRDIRNWDDITREEATNVIDTLKGQINSKTAEERSKKKQTEKNKCEDCGADITDTVAKYSKENFGRHLCMKCQKKQPDPFDIPPPEEPPF